MDLRALRRPIDSPDDPAPWADESAAPRPALDGDTTCDVLVVGAGLTGLWAAYYLLEADPALDVLLVESGASGQDERGIGACSARVGLDADGIAERYGEAAARDARAALRDAVVEVGGVAAVEEVECGFRFGGELVVAGDDHAFARLARQAAAATRWGDETHVLGGAALAEHVRLEGAVGGTWSPEAARLDPGALARGLRDAVLSRGARVVDRTDVARLSAGAAVTTHGTVRAATVVDTRPHGTRRTAATLATAPLPEAVWEQVGLARGEVLAHTDGLRVVREASGRLVAGRAPAAGRTRPVRAAARSSDALHADLVTLVPVLADAPVTHAWQRPLAEPGALPSVGLVDDHAWARSGGTGPAAANVAGRTLAELVTGTQSALTRAPWVRRG